MTQRKPSLPTHMSSEPIDPSAKHQTLWVFLLFVALLGFFGWVFPRNPGSSPTATLSQNNAPSNHLSGLREATAPRSTSRLGQAPGPESVRKIDDEIARILQGDFITNVYTLSSNKTLVEVGKLPPIFRKFGTEEFERLAKAACEKEFTTDPIATEYLEILEEHPAARDSGLIYSGIYIMYCSGEAVAHSRYNQAELLLSMPRDLEEAQEVSDPELRAEKVRSIRRSAENRIAMERLTQKAGIDRTRRLLEYLYGDLPKAVFQRLSSIEPISAPDPLPDP
jgi:hypothetical protein